jgi:hypothetical protein
MVARRRRLCVTGSGGLDGPDGGPLDDAPEAEGTADVDDLDDRDAAEDGAERPGTVRRSAYLRELFWRRADRW